MDETLSSGIGISAIATYEPPWVLANEWFGDTIPRKFVHHTGIESRCISLEDEITMAHRAVRAFSARPPAISRTARRSSSSPPRSCRSPSLVSTLTVNVLSRSDCAAPPSNWSAAWAFPNAARPELNWFCSGVTAGAVAVACRRIIPRLRLAQDQYLLVVTASRISRITDYGCKQTAALFGDLATVTLLARSDNHKHPVHFDILHADAEKQPVGNALLSIFICDRMCPCRGPTAESKRPMIGWCFR